MPPLVQLVLVLVSAVGYGWCFPPSPHPALAWVSLTPLLVCLRTGSTWRAAALGWLWTVLMTCTVNDWFPRAVSGYFGQSAGMGFALFLGVTTFTAGLQYAAFAAAYRRILRYGIALRPWLTAATWVAADLARLHMFGGDPWALAGYSQAGALPVIQIADLTGVHGVTFLIVAVNAAVAELWQTRRNPVSRAVAIRGLVLAGCTTLLVTTYGALRLHTDSAPTSDGIRVGIVQAHLPLGSLWEPEFYGRNLDVYLGLTSDIARSQQLRLVVWPEAAMSFFVADEPLYRQAIASVLASSGAELIAGGPFLASPSEETYYNSAFQLSARGEILGRYDKRVLLPFAEYLPFGSIDLLRRSFGRVRAFTAGDQTPPFDIPPGIAGVLICNEAFFPEPAAERVRDGASILVNLANDSWLADAKFSEPAFDMVRFRAVEQRRWIIRASTSGPSALVAPTGRVADRTDLLTAATLVGEVHMVTGRTIYGRVGDVFAWVCLAIALAALLL